MQRKTDLICSSCHSALFVNENDRFILPKSGLLSPKQESYFNQNECL